MWGSMEKRGILDRRRVTGVDSYIKTIRPERAFDIFNRLARKHNNDPDVLSVAARALNLPYSKQVVMNFNKKDGEV